MISQEGVKSIQDLIFSYTNEHFHQSASDDNFANHSPRSFHNDELEPVQGRNYSLKNSEFGVGTSRFTDVLNQNLFDSDIDSVSYSSAHDERGTSTDMKISCNFSNNFNCEQKAITDEPNRNLSICSQSNLIVECKLYQYFKI